MTLTQRKKQPKLEGIASELVQADPHLCQVHGWVSAKQIVDLKNVKYLDDPNAQRFDAYLSQAKNRLWSFSLVGSKFPAHLALSLICFADYSLEQATKTLRSVVNLFYSKGKSHGVALDDLYSAQRGQKWEIFSDDEPDPEIYESTQRSATMKLVEKKKAQPMKESNMMRPFQKKETPVAVNLMKILLGANQGEVKTLQVYDNDTGMRILVNDVKVNQAEFRASNGTAIWQGGQVHTKYSIGGTVFYNDSLRQASVEFSFNSLHAKFTFDEVPQDVVDFVMNQ